MIGDTPRDSIDVSDFDDPGVESRQRRQITIGQVLRICLLATVVGFVILVLNIPYSAIEHGRQSYGNETTFINLGYVEELPRITSAGWPFEYYLHAHYEQYPDLTLFSFARLSLNIALGVAVLLVDVVYRWHKSTLATSAKSNRIRLSVSDMLLLTSLCGGMLIYWQVMMQRSMKARELATKIYEQQGVAAVAPVLPAFLKDRLPNFVLRMHDRLVEVELNSPDNDLLDQIVVEPYLRKLSITGNSFDAERLHPLVANARLSSLRISGRKLDQPNELQMVGRMSQLTSLNLMRTSITSAALNQWSGLDRIRFMNLVHTDVVLSELSDPPWSKQISTLFLPRPPRGVGDSLLIDGWPNLKKLRIFEYEELVNDTAVTVKLSNLPALEVLSLDNFQLFDVDVDNAPVFGKFLSESGVLGDSKFWKSRMSKSQTGPPRVWLRRLRVKEAPLMSTLAFYVGDLEECSLSGIATDAEIVASSTVYSRQQNTSYAIANLSLSQRNRVLNVLSECEQLPRLILRDFDYTGIELDALKSNPSIESLTIENYGIEKAQIMQLAGWETLKALSVENGVWDGTMLNYLLKRLPNLERMNIPRGQTIDSLRLEGHPLKKLESRDGIILLSAVRLIDLPNFEAVLRLSYPVKHLHISNVPKLRGLVVQGVAPPDFVLEVSDSIEVLGIGGSQFTNDRLPPFSSMPKMKKLSLVDTHLSEDRLVEIGELSGLQALVLAGDCVTNQVISKLSKLTQLQRLEIVTNQSISGESLSSLGALENLKSLTLRLDDGDVSDYQWLSKLERLEMLRLDGWRCTKSIIDELAKLENLACLAFEGTELNRPELEALGDSLGNDIIRLGLQRSKVDADGLRYVLRRRPSVSFELRDAEVESRLLTEAMKSNRLYTTYIDELIDFAGSSGPRTWGAQTPFEDRIQIDAEWDAIDHEIVSPAIFRLLANASLSNSSTGNRGGPGRPSAPAQNKPTPTGNFEWLDLLDQIMKSPE
ncbi:hypothetical protein SH449x_004681 [Pirellulaceae bacterium SH449]